MQHDRSSGYVPLERTFTEIKEGTDSEHAYDMAFLMGYKPPHAMG
jgi:hypothetical protein